MEESLGSMIDELQTSQPSPALLSQDFRERYDAFVDASPQYSLYCHTWWLDAVAPGRYDILTVESGGGIKAAWPIVWAEEGYRRRAVMPELTHKLGILLAPFHGKYVEELSRDHEVIDALLDQLPPGMTFIQRFHESFTNWLPFGWKDYRPATGCTYVFEDLSNVDAVWDGMRRGARTEIRKAEKRGLRIRDSDDVERFYAMVAEIYRRQGKKTPYSFSYLARIDEACRKNAGRKILIAEQADGTPCAGRFMAYDQRAAFLLCGGILDVMRGSGANSLVDWEMIKFAATVSKRFDFTGSSSPKIEPYLRTFGARRMSYFVISGQVKVDSRWFRARRFAARVLRKLARMADGSLPP